MRRLGAAIPHKRNLPILGNPRRRPMASLAAGWLRKAVQELGGATRRAEHVYVRSGCISLDRGRDQRAAAPPVAQDPGPVIEPLAGPPQRPPRAAYERIVEDDHRIRGLEARSENVLGAEVAVENPAGTIHKPALHSRPIVQRERDQPGLPEVLVQLDDRQASSRTEMPRERRLARAATSEHQDPLHTSDGARRSAALRPAVTLD